MKSLCVTILKKNFVKKECIDRKCKKCGSEKLIEFYKPLFDQHKEDTVTVSQWIRKKQL